MRRPATVRNRVSGWRLKKMFSATVKSGTSGSSWNTTPTPLRLDSSGSRGVNRSPRNCTSPASAWYTPAITLMRVDLPAPFSPRRACISPPTTSKLTPLKALTPANALLIPLATRSPSAGSAVAFSGVTHCSLPDRGRAGRLRARLRSAGAQTRLITLAWSLWVHFGRVHGHERRAHRQGQVRGEVGERIDSELDR